MAVTIRMRQQGRKNRQTFRLVVTDSRNPRDGKYLETLGSYDPHRKENNLSVKVERLNFWLEQGAQLSENAEKLVKLVAPEAIRAHQEKRQAARAKVAAKRRERKKQTSTGKSPAQSAKKAADTKKKEIPAKTS